MQDLRCQHGQYGSYFRCERECTGYFLRAPYRQRRAHDVQKSEIRDSHTSADIEKNGQVPTSCRRASKTLATRRILLAPAAGRSELPVSARVESDAAGVLHVHTPQQVLPASRAYSRTAPGAGSADTVYAVDLLV